MLTDHKNRHWLVACLALTASFMGLMALIADGKPLNPAVGFVLMLLIGPFVLAAILPGLVWLGNAPIVRRLCEARSVFLQLLGAFLFCVAAAGIGIAFMLVWATESRATYAIVTGALAVVAYQQGLRCREEERFLSGATVFPVARLQKR